MIPSQCTVWVPVSQLPSAHLCELRSCGKKRFPDSRHHERHSAGWSCFGECSRGKSIKTTGLQLQVDLSAATEAPWLHPTFQFSLTLYQGFCHTQMAERQWATFCCLSAPKQFSMLRRTQQWQEGSGTAGTSWVGFGCCWTEIVCVRFSMALVISWIQIHNSHFPKKHPMCKVTTFSSPCRSPLRERCHEKADALPSESTKEASTWLAGRTPAFHMSSNSRHSNSVIKFNPL